MRKTRLAGVLLLAAVAPAASAQQGLYRFEITPTASYNWGGSTVVELHPGDAAVVGGFRG